MLLSFAACGDNTAADETTVPADETTVSADEETTAADQGTTAPEASDSTADAAGLLNKVWAKFAEDEKFFAMDTSSDFKNLSLKSLNKPFYGVYCGQSALPLEAEDLQYFTGGYIDSLKVYDFEHSKDMPVYDMEKANGKDPYEIYLSGSISLLSIDNPQAVSKKKLVVFRDSFGSSIAPLLASGYSKVTVVDIRYINSHILGNFIDFENADVLFLYSTLVLNNSEQFK